MGAIDKVIPLAHRVRLGLRWSRQALQMMALFLGITLPASHLAAAESCDCPPAAELGRGILWRGAEPIGLEEIARLAAPVLWYSSDEPLFLAGSAALPDPHPCDPKGGAGVVYYQAQELHLIGSERVTLPPQDDPDLFRKVDGLVLSYYFYYGRDIGMEPHTHDIEVVKMDLKLEHTNACYQLRLSTVMGLAHGVFWYNNILKIEPDTRLPITILVEEGKHASCPDRNADGIYTPGYDVNHRVNDAWGVRDVLGTGFLAGSSYQASMAKTRELHYRMLPPEVPERCSGRLSRSSRSEEMMGRYDLRPANLIQICDQVAAKKEEEPENETPEAREARLDRARIAAMMKDHHFGQAYEPNQVELSPFKNLTSSMVESPSAWIPSISLRQDGPYALGFTFIFRGINTNLVWAVPKLNLMRHHRGYEMLFTPSASRWADWYVTVGTDHFKELTKEVDGEEIVTRKDSWMLATEAGYRFRFRVPQKLKPATFWYDFGGVRFGVRSNGFDSLENLRLVAEIGAGVW